MPFISSIRGTFGSQGAGFNRWPFAINKFSNSTSGGTITTAGGYRIHTFTTSGTFTLVAGETASLGTRTPTGILNPGSWQGDVEYLVVAGGGGGGDIIAGGGGGGGYLSGTMQISTPQAITVGAGGRGGRNYSQPNAAAAGLRGGNSSISSLVVATGGGGAPSWPQGPTIYQQSGGSGAGGNGDPSSSLFGSGIEGQGYPGGEGSLSQGLGFDWYGGGGGGAGGAGSSAFGPTGPTGGAGPGGNGLSSSITGTSVTRAGGGGGGQRNGPGSGTDVYKGGIGGSGGGTNGAPTALNTAADAAAANTGGGGGGGTYIKPGIPVADSPASRTGGSGGPGIVVIRYLI